MNKFLCILGLIVFTSCSEAVLEPKEYIVVDTVETNRNGFNQILTYNVVVKVKEDSSLHYGEITPDGILVEINFKKIKNYYK
jgi:hypothetical protein